MRFFFFLLVVFGLLSSCSEEDVIGINIDPELQVHLDNFVKEAAKRGLLIDYNRLGVSIVVTIEDVEDHVPGLCNRDGGTREIQIDRLFWNSQASELKREWIIFHELGHCILGLGHNDAVDDMGRCVSMMNGVDYSCTQLYTTETRDNYLDGLFSE